MTTETTTIQELATRYAAQFETATRADGTTYTRVKDDAPDADALHDLIFSVHHNGAVLPDDRVYFLARAALEHIAEDGDTEDAHDFADGICDHLYSVLAAWLAEAPSLHGQYCEDAKEDFGEPENIWNLIQWGQYKQAEEVFFTIVEALTETVEG